MKHFCDLSELDANDIYSILAKAEGLKQERKDGVVSTALVGKKLAMIFEKSSTRTRVSFEVAMMELGGHTLSFNGNELQLGRGETVADTAKVLSRYVDIILLRCHDHHKLLELAKNATVPVINGLTEFSHPCQILADIMTINESIGNIQGKTVAWVGDGNNMAQSWIHAATLLGFTVRLACPKPLWPLSEVISWAKERGGKVTVMEDPKQATSGAHVVTTDTWVSMGDPDAETQMAQLAGYQVDEALMAMAAKDAIFLHCLPAHRGQEVTAGVIDGPQSRVFDEAENRLHIQKAILLWCTGQI